MVVERGVRVAVSDPQATATGLPREPWVSTIHDQRADPDQGAAATSLLRNLIPTRWVSRD